MTNNKLNAKLELENIVKKCVTFKGKSEGEISEQLSKMKIDLGISTLREKLNNKVTLETVNKIKDMEDSLPKILCKIYFEDKGRFKGQS